MGGALDNRRRADSTKSVLELAIRTPGDGDFDLDLDNKAYTPPRRRLAPKINPAQMEHGYREHVDESRNIRGLTSNGAWNANRTQANQERRTGC
jgi:hypothetical protein